MNHNWEPGPDTLAEDVEGHSHRRFVPVPGPAEDDTEGHSLGVAALDEAEDGDSTEEPRTR